MEIYKKLFTANYPSHTSVDGKTIYANPSHFKTHMTTLINMFLKYKNIPNRMKQAIITPIAKKGHIVREINNIRPIAVTSALTRIVSKLVTTRLGSFLAKNKILHSAQKAFIPGGNIHDALNALIATWEDNKTLVYQTKHKKYKNNARKAKGIYNIFYDISKAYDRVKWSSIVLSMRRLHIPDLIIDWTYNTLVGSKAIIKTGVGKTGLTDWFDVRMGIKQGDPLAPLLFVIFMDPLHQGYTTRGGYTLPGNESISSRGYADDTWIVADNLKDIHKMNAWTYEFLNWHGMTINVTKTLFVGMNAKGDMAKPDIFWGPIIHNHRITVVTPERDIRYLGLWLNLNLNWTGQINKISTKIHCILRRFRPYVLSPLNMKLAIQEILFPSLDLAFRHVPIPYSKLNQWNAALSRSILTCLKGYHKIKIECLATILKCHTISSLYYSLSTFAALVRLNTKDEVQKYHNDSLVRASTV
jgi:hypothetical protein